MFEGSAATLQAVAATLPLSANIFVHEGIRPGLLTDALKQNGTAARIIGFSEVLQFNINGEEIHIVRQAAGYSRSDCIAHFEDSGIVVFGLAVVSDAYPALSRNGADITGLLSSLIRFIGYPSSTEFVAGRGRLRDVKELRSYRSRIAALVDEVQRAFDSGVPIDSVMKHVQMPLLNGRLRNPSDDVRLVHAIFRSIAMR